MEDQKAKVSIFKANNLKLNNGHFEFLDLWEEFFVGIPILNWVNLYSRPQQNEIGDDNGFVAFMSGKTFKRIKFYENIY